MTRSVPPIAFTAAELAALAAVLAEVDRRSPLGGAARSALGKVAAVSEAASDLAGDVGSERTGRVVRMPDPASRTRVDKVNPAVRLAVGRAVADRRVIRLSYSDAKGRVSEREVEPGGLLAASGHWYLIGWCRSRQDGRGFRLDRIVSAEMTQEAAPNRDLAALLGPLGRGDATRAGLDSMTGR